MADTNQGNVGDGQSQTGGGDAGQSGQGAQQSAQTAGQQGGQGDAQSQSQTPTTQARGVTVKLTQEQMDRLIKDGTFEISDEVFTGAVKERMGQLAGRARTAEKRLAEIAGAQEESERKALVEQERFKELYEKESAARQKVEADRKEDLIRSRFLLAAVKAGVVDPDVAFVVARSLPGFATVQVGEDGKVTGIDEIVTSLVAEKPYLVSTQEGRRQSVGAASNPNQQELPPPKTLAEAGDRLEQTLRTGGL